MDVFGDDREAIVEPTLHKSFSESDFDGKPHKRLTSSLNWGWLSSVNVPPIDQYTHSMNTASIIDDSVSGSGNGSKIDSSIMQSWVTMFKFV